MSPREFENSIKHEIEQRRGTLVKLYEFFPEADAFLDWAINNEIIYKDVLDAVHMYIIYNTENRTIERIKEDAVQLEMGKYDFHIRMEDDEVVVDKFHAHVEDNSTAHMDSQNFKDPKDIISYIKEE